MKMTMNDICKATKGHLVRGDVNDVVTGVSTDSRTIKKGELFVALSGENYDGHKYLEEIFKKGAAGAIVKRSKKIKIEKHFKNVIAVSDTLQALGDLAHAWRMKFKIPVVAVTGSNGKTTTKDMIAALLATQYQVLKTEGNLNNLIGLPLTLFRMTGKEGVVVLEMGMNHPGEIDRLAEIASPNIGVITNIARAHLEGLGSLAAIAKAKGELLDHLSPEGIAVLNSDSPFFDKLKKRTRARVVGFGSHSSTQFHVTGKILQDLKSIRFNAKIGDKKASFRMPILGEHNVLNALAALAIADHFHISFAHQKKAVASFQAGSKRMEIIQLPNRIQLIQDCYNANPDSTRAALSFLQSSLREGRGKRRTVAILGEMLELGKSSAKLHREIGKAAAESGIKMLFAIGPHATDVLKGARAAGFETSAMFGFSTVEESFTLIRSLLRSNDVVLIKGSRGMKMERISEDLKNAYSKIKYKSRISRSVH